MLPVRLKPSHFLQLLMVSKSIKPPESYDDHQDNRHNDHNRRSDLSLPNHRALALHEGRNAVVLERHQRLGFRPTETSFAQSGILSSQLLDLSLELGDFIKF